MRNDVLEDIRKGKYHLSREERGDLKIDEIALPALDSRTSVIELLFCATQN